MLPRLILPIVFILVVIGFVLNHQPNTPQNAIRYVSLGDSYTYGEGALPGKEDWPTLLTEDLKVHGVPILLAQNLGHDNWTSQQVIDLELPIYKTIHPSFATLLVGANDWVQNIPPELFRQRFSYLLDQMLIELPNAQRLLVLTIPSYDTTPYGIGLGLSRNDGVTIQNYNQIIKQEADKRSVTVIDLFDISKAMRDDPTLLSPDQLHPSAKEYKIWEQLIFPVAYDKLKS